MLDATGYLVSANRQYQHNDCSGFVQGYDYEETNLLLQKLLDERFNPLTNRIVAAAIRLSTGDVLVSARHFDKLMHQQIELLPDNLRAKARLAEQGFIDKFGVFHNRIQAYRIAEFANQIVRCFDIKDELFSEHLY